MTRRTVGIGCHLAAAGRISMAAKPVKQLGPQTQLVDVSGAKSLEAAINAYRADSRVRLAAADLLMRATETPNYTCTVTMNAAKSVTARFDRTGE